MSSGGLSEIDDVARLSLKVPPVFPIISSLILVVLC